MVGALGSGNTGRGWSQREDPGVDLVRDPPSGPFAERHLDREEPLGDERVERALRKSRQLLDISATKEADAAKPRHLGRAKVPVGEWRSETERRQLLAGGHALGEALAG